MIAELLAQAVAKSLKDNIPRLAAALAYYSIISLAPLLLIALVVAGLTLGEQTGQRQIAEQMQGVTGNTGGPIIQALINQANQPVVGVVATVLGAVVLFFGAGGVFVELRDSLNMIWEVKSNHVGIIQSMVRERFLSLVMVLGMCFLLVGSVVVHAGMARLGNYLGIVALGVIPMEIIATILPLLVSALLFALMFKQIPDAQVRWKEVWLGATITAVLFTIGKSVIGLYLQWSGVDSLFGAAGSLVVFLIWIYYSAQVFLFGAEFTYVCSRYGKLHLESALLASSSRL